VPVLAVMVCSRRPKWPRASSMSPPVTPAMARLSPNSRGKYLFEFETGIRRQPPSLPTPGCRAGKLETFAKKDVQELFNEAEGDKEEQVLLLERLGFLERIVRERGPVRESLFQIPRLYTRCWDHA
jgi:hypothetical protein